ncbi:hypothetical protein P3L10_030417 [Capsicum annuum]
MVIGGSASKSHTSTKPPEFIQLEPYVEKNRSKHRNDPAKMKKPRKVARKSSKKIIENLQGLWSVRN